MKTATLFLALSLSVIISACGIEENFHKSGNGGSNGTVDDPFAEKVDSNKGSLVGNLTICKSDVYFYEYTYSQDSIGVIGSINHNDTIIHIGLYDNATNEGMDDVTNSANQKRLWDLVHYFPKTMMVRLEAKEYNKTTDHLDDCGTMRWSVATGIAK